MLHAMIEIPGYALSRPTGRWLSAAVAALMLLSADLAVAAPPYDRLDRGPRVGETIPHQLGARDHTGKQRNFGSLRGKNGLIVMFSRSFDW